MVFLALFYGIVWLAFVQVRPVYHRFLNAGAQMCYSIVGRRIEFRASGQNTVFRSYLKPIFEADFSPRPIYSNTPFFWTLLLVTPGLAWRRRALYLAIGTGALAISQIAFTITKVENALIAAGHAQAGAPLIWSNLDDFFEISGKAFIPILIWLALCLPYMLGKEDQPPVSAVEKRAVGRNDPCPCGSGRKYKHCCGKA